MIKFVKKSLPKSLFGRFLLIILLPNIIVQLFAVYMFYERHWSGVSNHMSVAFVGEVAMVVDGIIGKTPEERDEFIKLSKNNLYLDAKFLENKPLKKMGESVFFDSLLDELRLKIKRPHEIYYTYGRSKIAIDVAVNGGLLHILASKKRLANPSTYIFIMWMLGTAILFITISILFMRNQVRSISDLAEEAEKFGMGGETGDFKPTGAYEVRQVAKSFVDMRERIKKQIEQRTEMLAGVSHDLKTPLTRIKLQLAMMQPTKDIKELQEDISEMEKMIQGYIDFAKGKERVIDASVNVSDLLRSIVSGYRKHHKNIELKTKTGASLHINANDLRRVISNIIDNALRYGKSVKINMSKSEKNLIIMVDDDGPGIPVKERKNVFKPFYRIDNSRHLESGSTGLGLAIARDIIVSYGGSVAIDDSQMGGAQVVVKLPL